MAKGVREDMVNSASQLVRQHGVRGTSFPLVLESSGAPRGSISHHFPGGKAEMIRAAVQSSADEVTAALDGLVTRGASSLEVAERICGYFASGLERSGYRSGCPVAAVAHEPDVDAELLGVAQQAAAQWQTILGGVLRAEGHDAEDARRIATVIIAMVEGAIVLARLESHRRPMDDVAATCRRLLLRDWRPSGM